MPVLDQRMEALAVANERRLAICALRLQIKQHGYHDGMRFVAGMLRNPSAPVAAMRVAQLLGYVHRMSGRRAEEILATAGVQMADRRVRDLTPRQCNVIATVLENRARGWKATR